MELQTKLEKANPGHVFKIRAPKRIQLGVKMIPNRKHAASSQTCGFVARRSWQWTTCIVDVSKASLRGRPSVLWGA